MQEAACANSRMPSLPHRGVLSPTTKFHLEQIRARDPAHAYILEKLLTNQIRSSRQQEQLHGGQGSLTMMVREVMQLQEEATLRASLQAMPGRHAGGGGTAAFDPVAESAGYSGAGGTSIAPRSAAEARRLRKSQKSLAVSACAPAKPAKSALRRCLTMHQATAPTGVQPSQPAAAEHADNAADADADAASFVNADAGMRSAEDWLPSIATVPAIGDQPAASAMPSIPCNMPAFAAEVFAWTIRSPEPSHRTTGVPGQGGDKYWDAWGGEDNLAEFPTIAAYAVGQADSGLKHVWADCHDGIALKGGRRIWSLMQPEQDRRFGSKQEWRNGSKMGTQISHRKKIFYELCRRVQAMCQAASEAEPFTAAEALHMAVRELNIDIATNCQGSLSKWSKRPGKEQPNQYELPVLGWAAEKTMANGNPVLHKKRTAETGADAETEA